MKKIILFLSIMIIPLLIFVSNDKKSMNSKYDDLESAFLDYANVFLDNEELSSNSVKKDLSGFNLFEDCSFDSAFLEFKDENKGLYADFIGDSLLLLRLNTNIEDLDKSMAISTGNDMNFYSSSDIMDIKYSFLYAIDSSFGMDFVKENKDTIDEYFLLLEDLKDKGYITIDRCRSLLDLKLNSVSEILDMTGTYKHGYFSIYQEKNYTIKTYEDIVVDISISFNECKSGVNYLIALGMSNDFIWSDDNRIKIFIGKKNMEDVLESTYNSTIFMNISPDYKIADKVPKEEFYKLYNVFNSIK